MAQGSQTIDAKGGGLTRRQLLAIGWTVAGLVAAGEAGASVLAFMYPRLDAGSFGGKVNIGTVADAVKDLPNPEARPSENFKNTGRFYLTRTSDGLLALYRKCVHLGCVVPWNDAENQFHCPCHGSLYDRKGEVQGGPAPRPLDIFPITIEGGNLQVDTGKQTMRKSYDPTQTYSLSA